MQPGMSGQSSADDYLRRLSGGTPQPSPSASPAPTPPPLSGGPSEFTRVIASMHSPSTPPPPPPAATAAPRSAPPGASPSSRWLIIGIAGVFVAAVLFVLLVVLTGG
jgi:hypothetical protein